MADFKKLEDALAKAKSPIVRHFNPGITEDAILKHLQKLQMEPIEDLVDLYKWHNGINNEGLELGIDFLGLKGFFIPMSMMKECYQHRVDKSWIVSNDFSGSDLLPISYDDDLLVCLNKNSRFLGAVYIVSPAMLILEPRMIFDNIGSMIAGITECYNKNVYIYDEEGLLLDYDMKKESKIYKEFNPKSEYWDRVT